MIINNIIYLFIYLKTFGQKYIFGGARQWRIQDFSTVGQPEMYL
jgi:hypothetical protein